MLFETRHVLHWLAVTSRLRAEHERERDSPEYFDNIDAEGYRPANEFNPYKGKKGTVVPPGVRIGICVHQTATRFGTTKTARRKWELRGLEHGLDPLDAKAWGNRMALHERFWKVPYHVVSLQNGDVLLNNKLEHYTYHGGGANRLLYGWALEGNFPGLESQRKKKHDTLDDFLIETGRAGIRLLVKKARERGDDISLVLPHRSYECPGRAGDPGEAIWREIVIPETRSLQVFPDYERKHGTGLPVCVEWDAAATHDWRGHRVA
jgi:hypothetical protein